MTTAEGGQMRFINHSKIQFHIVDSTMKIVIVFFVLNAAWLAFEDQALSAGGMLCAAACLTACHGPITRFFDFKAFVELMAAKEYTATQINKAIK